MTRDSTPAVCPLATITRSVVHHTICLSFRPAKGRCLLALHISFYNSNHYCLCQLLIGMVIMRSGYVTQILGNSLTVPAIQAAAPFPFLAVTISKEHAHAWIPALSGTQDIMLPVSYHEDCLFFTSQATGSQRLITAPPSHTRFPQVPMNKFKTSSPPKVPQYLPCKLLRFGGGKP